jgi:hypothetical protein
LVKAATLLLWSLFYGFAAEEEVVRRWSFLALGGGCGGAHNLQIKLLALPLPLHLLGPYIPNARVVKLKHHSSPCVAINLRAN